MADKQRAHSISRILLIADEGDVRAVADQATGIAVDWVPDLERGCQRLDGDRGYDLVVVGVEPLEAIAERVPDVPLVALVEVAGDGAAALARGAAGFIARGAAITGPALIAAGHHAIALHRTRIWLREAREQLIHADRLASIGQLTAGVAHELNNPAASLLANLTTLKDQLSGASAAGGVGSGTDGVARELASQLREWADILDDSIAGIGHIRSIVRDLRNFSRVEHGAVGSVDLERVIEEACKITDSAIRPRARLIKDLAPLSPVRGDHGKLVQVFTNLLSNAAQAIAGSSADNYIRVSAVERDGLIIAAVEDTGCGIPEDARKLVFEPFFTTKPRDVGNGLGLALSAEIVHNHGGEIGFVSRDGGGTRFEVRLMADGEAGAARPTLHPMLDDSAAARVLRASGAARARVLLVDDEPSLLRAFRRLLAPRHEVVMAANGQQALDILATDTAFDGVICDFSMPDVDGISIYRTVADRDSELADRIVFCTGGPLSRRGRTFIESTRNTVLEKPVPPELLIGAIEQLGKRQR